MRSCILALVLTSLAPAEELPVSGLANLGIRVSDLEKARGYYNGLLGLEVAFERKDAAGKVVAACYKINDDQFLEIYPGLTADEERRRTHVAFLTADARRLHGMLVARGLKPGAIETNADKNSEFSIRAPEGTLLKFVEYSPDSPQARSRGKSLGPRRISKWLLHTGLAITDLAPSMEFYTEKLGFKEFWRGGPTPGETRWIMLHTQGSRGDYVEFMIFPNPPNRQQRGGLEHISLETPDINVAHKELLSRGLPEDARRKPILGLDHHWLLNVLDPDGTRTEFMESRIVEAGTRP